MDAELPIRGYFVILILSVFLKTLLQPLSTMIKGDSLKGYEAFALWFAGAIFLELIQASAWLNVVTGILLICLCSEQEKNRIWDEHGEPWNS